MYYPYSNFYAHDYRRLHRHYPYEYFYGYPYANPTLATIIGSQIASNNQSIYNAGVMAGVTQTANAFNLGRYGW